MKNKKFGIGKIIALIVVVVLAVVIVKKMTAKEEVVVEDLRPTVSTGTPENRDIVLYTDLIGTIEPQETVNVMPKMSGDVLEVNFALGDTVQAGQQLIKINSDALTALKIQVDAAKVSMDDAQKALERTTALFNGGTVSQQSLEQAQSGATGARLQYEAAKNSYDLQIKYTTVTAPIGGTIESKKVELHDMVSPSSVICVIAQKDQNTVKFAVSEKVMHNLSTDMEVTLDKNGTEYKGIITEISTAVDATSGLYAIKAAVENGEALTNGSKVKLSVQMDQAMGALTVPVNTVSFASGQAFVYTYEDGKAVKKNIEEGIFDNDYMEVVSGITNSDQVILTWNNELHDGAEVRLKDEAPTEAAAETTAAN